jgi:hypothetical protein
MSEPRKSPATAKRGSRSWGAEAVSARPGTGSNVSDQCWFPPPRSSPRFVQPAARTVPGHTAIRTSGSEALSPAATAGIHQRLLSSVFTWVFPPSNLNSL